MKLYHGTTIEISTIDLSKSKPNKDFGRGFYLSIAEEQAWQMANYKALQLDAKPIVNVFEFDERVLEGHAELKVKRFATYTKDWADFILANRNNTSNQPIHDYDIVFGPIANDKVGVQIRNLIEHNIDQQTFIERLKYMKGITFQYFFGTERAIKHLKKI